MQKIGILLCDQVDKSQIAKSGTYENMFKNFFDATGREFTYDVFNVKENEYPTDWNACDFYVVTGSKNSSYEDTPWIVRLREQIRSAHARHVKFFGVCFGHQIIAHSLGGRTEKNITGWGLGIQHFTVKNHRDAMPDQLQRISIGLSCQDQVTKLPEGATHMLTNDFVMFAGYTIGNTIISVQGHPEMSAAYLMYLIQKRLKAKQITHSQAAEKASSLMQPTHNVITAEWVCRFLNGR